MDPEAAAQMSETVAAKMLQYRRDASGWKSCRGGLLEPDGEGAFGGGGVAVVWYRLVCVDSDSGRYRGEGVLCGTLEEVWDCVKPVAGGLREKWDENVTSFEVIESITDTLFVSRTTTPSAAMKLISPRDFVDLVLIKKYEDGTITSNATHVEHALCPPKPGFVRGFNHPCGCFCEPLPGEPGKTRLVTFFQTDLSGYLPQGVVDSFFPRSMAGFYANLQKALTQFHN